MMCVDKLWCNGCGKKNTHFQYLSVVSNNLYQGAGSVCQNLVLGYHKTCFSWGFAEKWRQAQCKIRTFSFLSFLHLAILSWQKLQWFLLAARVESSINRTKINRRIKLNGWLLVLMLQTYSIRLSPLSSRHGWSGSYNVNIDESNSVNFLITTDAKTFDGSSP